MKIAILQTDHILKHRRGMPVVIIQKCLPIFFKLSVVVDFDIFDVTIHKEYPQGYNIIWWFYNN